LQYFKKEEYVLPVYLLQIFLSEYINYYFYRKFMGSVLFIRIFFKDTILM